MSEQTNYQLQVKVPHQGSGLMVYVPSDGYWNTVAASQDLDYLRSQKAIMDGFWKAVRIVRIEKVVYEEKVIDG